MATTNIAQLEEALQSGGRENRFSIAFTLPSGVSGDVRTLNILVKSFTTPGKSDGQIELKHSGLTHRIKGDEITEETWECEFQVPKDSKQIYKSMEDWKSLKENYKVQMTANQLDIQNNVTSTFTMYGVWVSALPGVNFSTESQDTIKTFAVTFSVDDIKTT